MKKLFIPIIVFALLIPGHAQSRSSTASQIGSVDNQFCSRKSITDVASELTRNWGERHQRLVEQATTGGMLTAYGLVVESNQTAVICRISFRNRTVEYPSHRVELNNVDFRYSEPDGKPQLEPITLPMTGFAPHGNISLIWERLFIDGKTYRSILETKAETDPAYAVVVSEVIGRPAGAENAIWEPNTFCEMLNATNLPPSVMEWAEKAGQVKGSGLAAKETPSWLPATDWTVSNLKVVSSIPFQSVICSANVSYNANRFGGKSVPIEIRGMSYKIWGNDDASQLYVEPHRWPTLAEVNDPENAFNRALVVNGRTLEQDTAAKRQKDAASGKPSNVLEALGQAQAQANAETEDYLKKQGVDVDAIKRAEDEETRKYAEPCRRNGGTWGRPSDKYGNEGRLGCYYPTGE